MNRFRTKLLRTVALQNQSWIVLPQMVDNLLLSCAPCTKWPREIVRRSENVKRVVKICDPHFLTLIPASPGQQRSA